MLWATTAKVRSWPIPTTTPAIPILPGHGGVLVLPLIVLLRRIPFWPIPLRLLLQTDGGDLVGVGAVDHGDFVLDAAGDAVDAGAGEDRFGAGGGEGVFGEEDGGGGGFHAVEGGLGGFGAVFGVVGLVVGDALECPDGLGVCFDLGVGDAGDAAGHRGLLVGSVDGYPLGAILPLVMRTCKCHFGCGAGVRMRCGGGGRSACVPDDGGLGCGGGEGRDAVGSRTSGARRSGCGGGVRGRGGRLQGHGEGLQGGEE